MKFMRRKPCANCPFRMDAKLAYWHPTMYEMLLQNEQVEGSIYESKIFGCHKDRKKPDEEHEPCVGWLIHQREKGVPSISLRILLSQSGDEAAAQYEESECDQPLYDSVTELVQANLDEDRHLNPERYESEADE